MCIGSERERETLYLGKMVYVFTEYSMYVWQNAGVSKNRKEEAEQKIIHNNNNKELGFNFMAPKT
jgi:hypothetical protein